MVRLQDWIVGSINDIIGVGFFDRGISLGTDTLECQKMMKGADVAHRTLMRKHIDEVV